MSIFTELGLVIILAGILGYFTRLVKQPLILAYIFAGIILGPSFFNLIKSEEVIYYFSSLGIAFLLFTIGLELDLRKFKKISFLIAIVGLGQIIFTGLFGFFLSYFFGFSVIVALYLGLALAFSSTAVVVKLLSDSKDLDSLQGKFIIGTMLIQDLVAVLAMAFFHEINFLSSFQSLFGQLFLVLIKAGVFLFGAIFLGRVVVSRLLNFATKTPELLFLASLSWCLALIFAAQSFGLSLEIGAFLAGLGLAGTAYNLETVGKMRPLRDFFLIIFFTSLGMQMAWPDLKENLVLVSFFSLFVIFGNPLIVWIFMGILGFTKRVSFLTGLATGQISEFSIILIILGVKVGHLDSSLLSLITILAVITILISSYFISHSHKIYLKIGKYLNIFERKKLRFKELMTREGILENHTILFGCDRMGSVILKNLQKRQKKVLVIDFNLETVEKLRKQHTLSFYGDIEDPEIIEKANLDKAKMIISTVPDLHSNLFLLSQIKNKNSIILITCQNVDEALELYEKGIDYAILPLRLSGEYVAMLLDKLGENKTEIDFYRHAHIQELKKAMT
ncbi:MAG: cation:proton antiporter [Patescibacteria group bacterium]